ncbi:MAG: hypothetical protein LBK76_11390 [Verrucomicrobiales bacterium]|jgi:hypothetical protein|nr:hypothetical protein [Verrucomicrobiales bacterium]
MKLLGIVHQLYGTDNHELHYAYLNAEHIAYMSKFPVGDIRTQIVLTTGTIFYCTQDIVELARELMTVKPESSTSSPFLI